MTVPSSSDLLVLHAVRLLGFAETPSVANRFALDVDETAQAIAAAEERGWVRYSAFAGLGGWSLTEAGRQENQRQLAAVLSHADDAPGANGTPATDEIRAVYRAFLPLNHLLQQACTDWQIRPNSADPLAANDHSDSEWDAGVLDELAVIARGLAPLAGRLAAVFGRFDGYHRRFTDALQRARAGEDGWVDGTEVDSCHRVWFQLHEDLIATLGVNRGSDT